MSISDASFYTVTCVSVGRSHGSVCGPFDAKWTVLQRCINMLCTYLYGVNLASILKSKLIFTMCRARIHKAVKVQIRNTKFPPCMLIIVPNQAQVYATSLWSRLPTYHGHAHPPTMHLYQSSVLDFLPVQELVCGRNWWPRLLCMHACHLTTYSKIWMC